MRILHISDLHFRGPTLPAFTGKRLTGWLNWVLLRRHQFDLSRLDAFLDLALREHPDAVALTGDLTQLGMTDEIPAMLHRLAVLPENGIALFLTPGNHDCYVETDAALSAFAQARAWTCQCGWTAAPLSPGVIRIARDQVEILLLQQARPTGWFMAWGALSNEDWSVLEGSPFANDGSYRLAFGHYPLRRAGGARLPRSHCLRGSVRLEEALARHGVGGYGCGHIHAPFEVSIGSMVQVCPGSLTAKGTYTEILLDDSGWHFFPKRLE